MASDTVRERLVAAAFAAFAERGYEQTTVEAIAAGAGVGRTTFFRTFRGKEDVASPDHDRVLAAAAGALTAGTRGLPREAAREATLVVLRHYVQEGALARSRYELTSRIPALRDREVANVSRYQRMFYEHFRRHEPDLGQLDAEMLAAAAVTVHNHVLRRWLRGETTTPEDELSSAWADVMSRLGPRGNDTPATAIAVFTTDQPLDAVRLAVQNLLAPHGSGDGER